jgi:DedD protein
VDSQVKERIVGAIVLVALGVWLIPWVLDGPAEPARESESATALELPASEARAPVRTETVELETRDAAPASGAGADTAAFAATGAGAASAATTDGQPGADPDAAGRSEPTAGATSAAPDASGKTGPTSDAGDWSVQIGSFGELANARQLASRVADYGYEADVSEFQMGGRTMHRVRVGGFESRDEAEDAASSLSAQGFRPRVFPPE